MRNAILSAFSKGDSPHLPVGKTIGQVITDERKQIQGQKVKDAAEMVAKEKAQAEEAVQRERMNQSLSVVLYGKGFLPSDLESGRYQDHITIKLAYKNTSEKKIRAFRGAVEFKDLFGDTIKRVGLKEENSLDPGAFKRVERTIDFNQFIDSDKKLAQADIKNLKAEWKPDLILFSDGTSLRSDTKE
jgi:hypothetical protein